MSDASETGSLAISEYAVVSSIVSSVSLSSIDMAAIAIAALAAAESEFAFATALSNRRTLSAWVREFCPMGQDVFVPSLDFVDLMDVEVDVLF